LGDRNGIWPVKKVGFVGGDDLTGALHVLQLQLSPPLPSSLAPIKPTNPGKWPLKWRERGGMEEREI